MKITVSLAILSTVIGASWFFYDAGNLQDVEEVNPVGSTSEPHVAKVIHLPDHTTGEAVSTIDIAVEKDSTPVSISKIREWQRERFGSNNILIAQIDYKDYDLETLKLLGEQGDITALNFLGYKYIMQHDTQKAIDAYYHAAVLGSTASLNLISLLKADGVDKSVPFSREREIFVYLQAAILRGDMESLNTAKGFFSLQKVEFNEIDKQYIQENGGKIYNELIASRESLGLSEFDNSMPDFMIEYNRKVENDNAYLNLTTGDSPLFVTKL